MDSAQSPQIQMADSHLTYIGSRTGPGGLYAMCYDVYPRSGGPQLGWVYGYMYGLWTAVSADHEDEARARTRWEATTKLWGEARRG